MDQTKQPMKAVYLLGVGDDTPYHEGVEYWWRNDVMDLFEILWDEWSWMESACSLAIEIAVLNVKGHELLWSDETEINITEIITRTKKAYPYRTFAEVRETLERQFGARKYPPFAYVIDDLYMCRWCDIITDKLPDDKKCPECCREYQDMEEKIR